MEEYQKTL